MTTLDQFPARDVTDPIHVASCKECGRHFIAAEREMSAFVKALDLLFGRVESLRAEAYWLALAESADVPLVDGYPAWRNITILAADRFASTIVKVANQRGSKEEISAH
jgi:hypothetical protein